jgi:hypothetical protein
MVLGVEGEHPWRSHDDVVDVAASFRDDNAVGDVPASIFGEARIQEGTDDLFAVGADVPPLGRFPKTSSLLVVVVRAGLQFCSLISRSISSVTPSGDHGLRPPTAFGS